MLKLALLIKYKIRNIIKKSYFLLNTLLIKVKRIIKAGTIKLFEVILIYKKLIFIILKEKLEILDYKFKRSKSLVFVSNINFIIIFSFLIIAKKKKIILLLVKKV